MGMAHGIQGMHKKNFQLNPSMIYGNSEGEKMAHNLMLTQCSLNTK